MCIACSITSIIIVNNAQEERGMKWCAADRPFLGEGGEGDVCFGVC